MQSRSHKKIWSRLSRQKTEPCEGRWQGCNCQPGPVVDTLAFGGFHEGQSHAPRAAAKAVVLCVSRRSARHTQLRPWHTAGDVQDESTVLTRAPKDGHRSWRKVCSGNDEADLRVTHLAGVTPAVIVLMTSTPEATWRQPCDDEEADSGWRSLSVRARPAGPGPRCCPCGRCTCRDTGAVSLRFPHPGVSATLGQRRPRHGTITLSSLFLPRFRRQHS